MFLAKDQKNFIPIAFFKDLTNPAILKLRVSADLLLYYSYLFKPVGEEDCYSIILCKTLLFKYCLCVHVTWIREQRIKHQDKIKVNAIKNILLQISTKSLNITKKISLYKC